VIGRTINNYEVTGLLGAGGMGAVYRARHPLIQRELAVKILRPELAHDRTLVQRFLNEARAAHLVRHPNIIEVLDLGVLPDGVPYLFMELLDGEPLSRRIARLGRVPIDQAITIAWQTAGALAAAHARDIVHRDLKPDNIFLARPSRQADHAQVKVLDFGVAKLRRELSTGSLETHAGAVLGTPIYMSPEQGKGVRAAVDGRTDVYALGIILYEMLTGRPPFVGEGFGEIVVLHATQPPLPPRTLNPEISPELDATVLAALAKQPAARIPSMEALRARLGDRSQARLPLPPKPAVVHLGATEILGPIAQALPATVPLVSVGPSPSTLSLASSAVPTLASSPPRPPRWAVVTGISAAVSVAVAALAISLGVPAPRARARRWKIAPTTPQLAPPEEPATPASTAGTPAAAAALPPMTAPPATRSWRPPRPRKSGTRATPGAVAAEPRPMLHPSFLPSSLPAQRPAPTEAPPRRMPKW
jgi:serine/threonine protein kinase